MAIFLPFSHVAETVSRLETEVFDQWHIMGTTTICLMYVMLKFPVQINQWGRLHSPLLIEICNDPMDHVQEQPHEVEEQDGGREEVHRAGQLLGSSPNFT